ncbi:MAG: sodium-dependent bicarbonate transport family permease, partial [Rubrivivax sp.]
AASREAAGPSGPGGPGAPVGREPRGAARAGRGALLHDVLFGKSVLLLVGGLAIGAVAGEAGVQPIRAVFIDPFKGVLALFLLELGLVAGARLVEVRRFGPVLLVVGLGAPPVLALLGAATGVALGLSTGGVALLATLAASASYIAAPTAMRIAVPQANPALSITAALGLTFPFNIVVGIPLYIELARRWTA